MSILNKAKGVKLVSPNPWAQISSRVNEAQTDHRQGKPHYYEDSGTYNRAIAISDQSTFTIAVASETGLKKEFSGYGQ
jgi:hypothetical protein